MVLRREAVGERVVADQRRAFLRFSTCARVSEWAPARFLCLGSLFGICAHGSSQDLHVRQLGASGPYFVIRGFQNASPACHFLLYLGLLILIGTRVPCFDGLWRLVAPEWSEL